MILTGSEGQRKCGRLVRQSGGGHVPELTETGQVRTDGLRAAATLGVGGDARVTDRSDRVADHLVPQRDGNPGGRLRQAGGNEEI